MAEATEKPSTAAAVRKSLLSRAVHTLRFNIATLFVALFVGSSLLVAWYTHRENTAAVLDLADDVIAQVSDSAIDKTLNHLNPLITAAEVSARGLARSPVALRGTIVEPLVMDVLRAHPAFYSFYVGLADGGFVQGINLPDGIAAFGPLGAPPPSQAVRVLRVLSRRGEARESWIYLDAEGNELRRERSPKVEYDPRQRPWYRGAVEAKGRFWTELYIFYSLQSPGLTAAFPIVDLAGNTLGVVGADLSLRGLSQFLADQRIGRNGRAFIVNAASELVAYPDASRAIVGEGREARSARLSDFDDPALQIAARRFRPGERQKAIFDAAGEPVLAAFSPFPADFGKAWSIGVVVPVDDYVGPVRRANRNALLLALAAIVVGVLGINLISRWVARPIDQLAEEARRVRDFDFDDPVVVSSRITEIQELADSMATMKRAMLAFSKFVPRGLVQQLIATGEGESLGGRRAEMTIMFSDIENFTSISEGLSPEALALHLSDYFENLTKIVRGNGGAVDKYIGDSIMAFWGAPVWYEDHTERACLSVLLMRAEIDRLCDRWARQGKPLLRSRIGLHCGEMIVGNIGSSERMNYTVLGDPVNVASRLEGINKIYGTFVCISESVRETVGDRFLSRPLDVVSVKGRQGGTPIHELVAMYDPPDPALAPNPEDERRCALTKTAFEAYLARDWQGAIDGFAALAAAFPEDGLPALYKARCEAYRADPPPDDWDRIFNITEKF